MMNLISNLLLELNYILYKNINWPISWKVIEKYSDKINLYTFAYWNLVSSNKDISPEFMEKYDTFLNWEIVSENKIFTNIDEVMRFENLNITSVLINNKNLINDEILNKFRSSIDWERLIWRIDTPYIRKAMYNNGIFNFN